MNNCFSIMFASIISIQTFANIVISNKIDATLNLINEEMVAASITEKSKLEAYHYNDPSELAIDQKMLMKLVSTTIEKNLSFLDYEANYYFYHNKIKRQCPIDTENYICNSVQMQIIIFYQNKSYEENLRYEPTKIY